MITRTSATTSDDRAEALRSIMEATAAAVSTHAAKRAVVFRAAGRGESGVATDIRVGRHEILIRLNIRKIIKSIKKQTNRRKK